MKNQPAYYGILPANVRYDNALVPMEKIMYTEITALSNKYGYCDAKNSYFAELYEVDPRTAGRWIRSLEREGHVSIDQDPLTGHNRKIYPRTKISTPPGQKSTTPPDKKVLVRNNTREIVQEEYSSSIDIEQPHLNFDKLWDLYAYKQNKKKALTAWKRLSKAKKELLYDSIPHYLTYLQSPENAYRQQMLLATYINGEQWDSDWSVETVDNTITTLIGDKQLSPELFDKYSTYHAWVKKHHPGLFTKCRILTAEQYLSHLPTGWTYLALRKAMSQSMIRDAITQAHVSAAEKLEKGRAVESVAAELKSITEKTFA